MSTKTTRNSRAQLDKYRVSFWRRVVWVNQVLPGTITISIADLKAMSKAERLAFLGAVEEVAIEMQEAAKPKGGEGEDNG